MQWIFLSPHFDDAAFSCGGLIWDLTQAGEKVEIWTICAGEPEGADLSEFARSLHSRWGLGTEIVSHRRIEDESACAILNATPRYFQIPDCIYRRSAEGYFLYSSEESLSGQLHPFDRELIDELAAELRRSISGEPNLVCPLGVGHHVDHQLVRSTVEVSRLPRLYYVDIPYALQDEAWHNECTNQLSMASQYPISPAGMENWLAAIQAYPSQFHSFWPDTDTMQSEINHYSGEFGGIPLWKPVGSCF